LVTLEIPSGVIIEGDMLGNIVALKFVDHDITDEKKFSKIAWEKSLCPKIVLGTGAILLEP
jgi:hypothetical protein